MSEASRQSQQSQSPSQSQSASGRKNDETGLRPNAEAIELGRHMLQADPVMRAIIEETIQSARSNQLMEAGRTACGSLDDLRQPHNRFPMAVELQECPVTDATGIWHTHVTQNQLRHPHHSLPDVANVALSNVDASVVAGTRSAELIVVSEDRGVMAERFRDALGLNVETPDQVAMAVLSGDIPRPQDAYVRVSETFDSLINTRRTGYSDLDSQLDIIPTEQDVAKTAARAPVGIGCSAHAHAVSPDVANLRSRARALSGLFEMFAKKVGVASVEQVAQATAANFLANIIFKSL